MSQPEKIDLVQPARARVGNLIQSLPPSGIREFFELVIGRDDIISLGVGEPDFVTPYRTREAAIFSINQGQTSYTSNAGLLSLRKAISKYLADRFQVEADAEDEVLITVGVSEGIDLALRAILNPGDEVIIPEPCYIAYDPLVQLAGGVPISLACSEENGFHLNLDDLEKLITPRTRALVLNYPCNPTGTTLNREEIERLAQIARASEMIVISDEIYAEMTFAHKHVSLASIPEAADWTILLSGFSKAFAMTGWRIGYASGPAEIISAMKKIHQYNMLCAPIMSQRAAESALTEGMHDMEQMVEVFRQRGNYIHSGFEQLGLKCVKPEGAFYAFPSIKETGLTSQQFCRRLLEEEKVAVVPGSAFGPTGEGHFRAAYAASFESIDRALEGIYRFLSRL